MNIRVYVVDADEVVFDEDFTLLGRWDWKVGLVLEDFCSSGLLDQDAFHRFGDLGRGGHGFGCWKLIAEERQSGVCCSQLSGNFG